MGLVLWAPAGSSGGTHTHFPGPCLVLGAGRAGLLLTRRQAMALGLLGLLFFSLTHCNNVLGSSSDQAHARAQWRI